MIVLKGMKHTAFTLVEMLVSVSIILIVSAITIPSFSAYLGTQYVKQAQELLKSDLRNIQNKALTGSGSDLSVAGAPATKWFVKLDPSSSTYTFYLSSDTSTASSCPDQAKSTSKGTSILNNKMVFVDSVSRCVIFEFANVGLKTNALADPYQTDYAASFLEVGDPSNTANNRKVYLNIGGLIYSK